MSLNPLGLLAEHADYCLRRARAGGADEAAVYIGENNAHSVQCRGEAIEELSRAREQRLALTVYCGKRSGSASVSEWSRAALDEAVDAALAAAQFTEADADFGLPDPALYAHIDDAAQAALDLYDDAIPDSESLMAAARACEAAAYAADARIVNSDGGSASVDVYQHHYATSNGFAHGARGTRSGLSVSVLAKSGDSQQRDYDYDHGVRWQGLRAPESIGQQAAARALAALHPQAMVSGEYPVLLHPQVAAGFFGHLLQALNGRAQYRKLSFLAGALEQQVLPEWLSLRERPHLPGFAASALCDSDGIATQESDIIHAGRVARYLLGHYSAKRLGMRPTGNAGGVRNLGILADARHIYKDDALLREMDRGVLITSVMGQGVNLLTGDYSRGASGFWVEGGEIVHPVEGITLAGRLQDMYAGIVALGDDIDWRGNIHAPSVLLAPLTVAQ
ncbi:MAG: metallopeptidase TldD-related protein [Cardiobacteriaceae bacterium]|nr:metallopeptidase TldD-related protein [Cardiobacteriaceae bacterium]